MQAQNIDEVITLLDQVIARCKREESRLGYFPALYRKVTINVKEGIQNGVFEDGPRMEKLDVIFANRYLEAIHQYWAGEAPSRAWAVSFKAAERPFVTVLQHLLMGMNAHINLDLGIAAARTAPGDEISGLRDDFNRINTLLANLVGGVKEELTQVWPTLAFLDKLAGRAEDVMINFSMTKARDHAWAFAETLAPLSMQNQGAEITGADESVTKFAEVVWKPGTIARIANAIISLGERGTVSEIIDLLE